MHMHQLGHRAGSGHIYRWWWQASVALRDLSCRQYLDPGANQQLCADTAHTLACMDSCNAEQMMACRDC